MQEISPAIEQEHEEIKPSVLEKIQTLLLKLNIKKIFFIDDAINQATDVATFSGLIQSIISQGKIDKLREITLQGIDFNTDEAVLIEHINEKWDSIKHGKQLKYFKQVHTIAGNPEAINDLNVSNNLQDFFRMDQISFLTPTEWDQKHDEILNNVNAGEKILVIFDQDLKLAGGRYTDDNIQGENLISELKLKNPEEKVIVSLLTHTITDYEQELSKRAEICERINTLNSTDFFVLAKVRLEKPEMFADGIKKILLNTFCEKIKIDTIDILISAQAETINQLRNLDTYDFDHTIFKSSFTEGVWEPETLLRITGIIFNDEVRKLMIKNQYVPNTNPVICKANEISKIEFKVEENSNPYKERFKLRHQEIYESGELLNNLKKPIDNGDIITIKAGEKAGKTYILVAQECDLMVRSDGTRGARTGTLLEIKTLKKKDLNEEMKRKYEKDYEKGKFQNHYFSDKYKLEYFESGTQKIGIVNFSSSILIDLNVLDLIVFSNNGEASLDLTAQNFDSKFHNEAWQKRYELLCAEFLKEKEVLDRKYSAIEVIEDVELKSALQTRLNYLFSFINKAGIQINYGNNQFDFGLKRIARLRIPKSKYLMDRYYQHLSRTAEQHDFAD